MKTPTYSKSGWTAPRAQSSGFVNITFNPLTTFAPERSNSDQFPVIPGAAPRPSPLSEAIYKHRTYFTLFSLSSFIPPPRTTPPPDTKSHYQHLLDSIHFFTAVVNNSPCSIPHMHKKSLAMEAAAEMIKMLPCLSSESPNPNSLFVNFLDR